MKLQIELKGFTPLLDTLVKEFGIVTAAVYGIVWRYAQMEDKVCRASLEKIADRVNVSSKTAERHIKRLCASGYLEDLTPKIKNKPHIYIVTGKAELVGVVSPEIRPDRESDLDQLGQTESLTRPDRESYPGQTESPLKKHDKIHNKKQSPNGGNGSTTIKKQPPTIPPPNTKTKLTDQQADELLLFGKHPDSDAANPSFDTIQEIQKAGWEIRNYIVEQAIAYYLEAVREHHTAFAIPNNESVRKDWYKEVNGHLQDHRVDELKVIYPAAIQRLADGGMTFSRPGSLTKSLPDVANETQTGDVVAWL